MPDQSLIPFSVVANPQTKATRATAVECPVSCSLTAVTEGAPKLGVSVPADILGRLRALILEAPLNASDEDIDQWRERCRSLLGVHYGSLDHDEVRRFVSRSHPSLMLTAETVRTGRFAAAQLEAVRQSVSTLRALAEELEFASGPTQTAMEPDPSRVAPQSIGNERTVFLVHGRDDAANRATRELLRAFGLNVIEWEDAVEALGDPMPYIGDVVETGLTIAAAVVVLFTADDLVSLRPDLVRDSDDESERTQRGQPRPNVVFEAGYARAFAPSRTLMVSVGEVKLHSDISGRLLVRLDNSPVSRHVLAQRLRLTGLQVNTSGTDWLQAGAFPASVPERAPTAELQGPDSVSHRRENLTLQIADGSISAPTDAAIESALTSLHETNGFAILHDGDGDFIQTTADFAEGRQPESAGDDDEDATASLVLEYQRCSIDNHFEVPGLVSLAIVTATFLSFARGDSEWRSTLPWVEMSLGQ